MIEVKCNGKVYKFPESSEIIDQLDMQAEEVTDDLDSTAGTADRHAAVYTHDVAAAMLEKFEDLLDKKEISIPCWDEGEQAERDADPENGARIYGTEYSDLLDDVETDVIDAVERAQAGAGIVRYEFSGTM